MKGQAGKRRFRELVTILLAVLLFTFLAGNCGNGPSKDEVRRLAPVVWAGSPASSPPVLNHNNWQDLNVGEGIKTDVNGEAEVRLVDCSGSFYVFRDSLITVATCRKSQQQSGSGACGAQGTASYHLSCPRFSVDTISARVTILATAFSVTYLPAEQLTLVNVLDGNVEVLAVTDVGTDELTAPIAVEAGHFIYTMPGTVSREVAGVPARSSLPLEELPALVEELGIQPWMEDVGRRAREDNLLPPNWPFPVPGGEPPPGPDETGVVTVELSGAGGPLEDESVWRAVNHAINQDKWAEQLFPGQRVELRPAEPYDPDLARDLLAQADFPEGFALQLAFPQEDEQLSVLAEVIAEDLGNVGINSKLVAIPGVEMEPFVRTQTPAGVPVLWLTRLP